MYFWEFFKNAQQNQHKAVIFNTCKNIGGALFLFDPELVQEFIKIEHEVANKQTMISNTNFGFFWKNGKEAMVSRAAFG